MEQRTNFDRLIELAFFIMTAVVYKKGSAVFDKLSRDLDKESEKSEAETTVRPNRVVLRTTPIRTPVGNARLVFVFD